MCGPVSNGSFLFCFLNALLRFCASCFLPGACARVAAAAMTALVVAAERACGEGGGEGCIEHTAARVCVTLGVEFPGGGGMEPVGGEGNPSRPPRRCRRPTNPLPGCGWVGGRGRSRAAAHATRAAADPTERMVPMEGCTHGWEWWGRSGLGGGCCVKGGCGCGCCVEGEGEGVNRPGRRWIEVARTTRPPPPPRPTGCTAPAPRTRPVAPCGCGSTPLAAPPQWAPGWGTRQSRGGGEPDPPSPVGGRVGWEAGRKREEGGASPTAAVRRGGGA